MKYKIVKIIDVTGLTFLTPIVLLCYGEEPRVQLKKIFQFIVVPVFFFTLFLLAWDYMAPRHKTKYGAVPRPAEVWDSFLGIINFHNQENTKELAYEADGEDRAAILEKAEAELIRLKPLREQADKDVLAAREKEKARKDELISPIQTDLDAMKDATKKEKSERLAAIKKQADELKSDEERKQYVLDLAAYEAWVDQSKDQEKALRDAVKAIQDEKDPQVVAALKMQTQYADEVMFWGKVVDYSTKGNKYNKVAEYEKKNEDIMADFASLEGSKAYLAAKKIVSNNERIDKAAGASFPKPWTLPMQIVRSIFCVFTGFIIGVMVAVPLGILCGLSKTFMAGMTPFIALFKPVSPIVWLIIFWIVVGGFFPDPNNSWFLDGINEFLDYVCVILPYVKTLEINPAFIASALTVSMCSLWATLVNTALGVASIDKDHMNVARVLRLGFWSRLFKIVLPASLPLVFAGMRISLGVGWMVLIAAELLANSEGVGKYVNDMFNNGSSQSFAQIMCIVFVVGIIGLILDRIMIVLQRSVSFDGSVAAV